MNSKMINTIKVIATGILVIVLLSVLLFWSRLFCWASMIIDIPESSSRIIISPSGLVPGEPAPQQIERLQKEPTGPNEPNFEFSRFYATIENKQFLILNAIGVFWDVAAKTATYRDVNERVYYWYKNGNEYLCFDKRSGLMTARFKLGIKDIAEKGEVFAGPNGVSEATESSLGRFYNPLVTGVWGKDPTRMCLYDKRLRRFYVIDFKKNSVIKGLQLTEDDSREPVMIGEIRKRHTNVPLVWWNSPKIWNDVNSRWERQGVFYPGSGQLVEKYHSSMFDWSLSFIPVLDKTGQIDIYNTSEQSLTSVGYLPIPKSPFTYKPNSKFARPADVLGYHACTVYAIRKLPDNPNEEPGNFDVKYLGMSVVCVSREGASMTAAVFDPKGGLIYQGDNKMNKGESAIDTMYAESPGASFWTSVEFFLENLQPPVFEVASYLSRDYFEASAGHQALFILPNSFIGMIGRVSNREDLLGKQVETFWLIAPSLVLSVWLTIKVRKNATQVGLTDKAKKWWTIGTLAFGLPAYITYRLTRPKVTLVSCQNCGKMRRPDMETCHHCGSKWEVPELTPPNWRIKD